MLRSRIAAISATLAVVAVACGGTTEVATDAGATAPEAPAATAPGTDAPDAALPPAGGPTEGPEEKGGSADNAEVLAFSAQAVGGGTVDGADYAGGDVVLWIWAPW